MNPEPRQRDDYSLRQIEAAHRVLVDLGQVLAAFGDCLVVIGGWVPDLLLEHADEPHVGSIDVDLALDAGKLSEGRYADLLKLLLDTGRYKPGTKSFQLVVEVNLKDGDKPVEVEVEFLAPKGVKLKKNRPKLLQGFRVLQADACGTAFHAPVEMEVSGKTVRGANNTVRLRVASLPDFLIMKAHALAGRDKPKDAYDLCYCLEHFPGGTRALAAAWKSRRKEKDVARAIEILTEKFATVNGFGPGQIVEFHGSPDAETQAMQSRRAFEAVQQFLSFL
ncbi:MAG: nucleotidyl transferase AbiEii/AbiGii toxin family protein [Planctomycetes bacterium]|nr:nucleotidyl transferase AbiEii/AbiGii toxin family protein [Planctomycetota bacterium]